MANSCASTIGCDMPPLRGWGSVCPFLLQTWRSYGAELRACYGDVPYQAKLRSSAMFVEMCANKAKLRSSDMFVERFCAGKQAP